MNATTTDQTAQYRELCFSALRQIKVRGAKNEAAYILALGAERWLERELRIAAAARIMDREELFALLIAEAEGESRIAAAAKTRDRDVLLATLIHDEAASDKIAA
jgi:hypothetical protein